MSAKCHVGKTRTLIITVFNNNNILIIKIIISPFQRNERCFLKENAMHQMKATDEQIVEAIRKYWEDNGYSPTFEEIRESVGIQSQSTIFERLNKLKNKGLIDYISGQTRTITVTADQIKYIRG